MLVERAEITVSFGMKFEGATFGSLLVEDYNFCAVMFAPCPIAHASTRQ
jgi:hypothetical protein